MCPNNFQKNIKNDCLQNNGGNDNMYSKYKLKEYLSEIKNINSHLGDEDITNKDISHKSFINLQKNNEFFDMKGIDFKSHFDKKCVNSIKKNVSFLSAVDKSIDSNRNDRNEKMKFESNYINNEIESSAKNSSNNISSINFQESQIAILDNNDLQNYCSKDCKQNMEDNLSQKIFRENNSQDSKMNTNYNLIRVNFKNQDSLIMKNYYESTKKEKDIYVTNTESIDKIPSDENENHGENLINKLEKKISKITRRASAPFQSSLNNRSNKSMSNVFNEVYSNCTKNIHLSSKLDSIIIKNNDKLNREMKNNFKKDNKRETQDLLKNLNQDKHNGKLHDGRTKKEKLKLKYMQLLEAQTSAKNSDLLGKISDRMALEFRKELIKKFKYNYKNDKDYIFDDYFLEEDTINDFLSLKKNNSRERSKNKIINKHLKVENFLNITLRKKEKLIDHIDESLGGKKSNNHDNSEKKVNRKSNPNPYQGDLGNFKSKIDKSLMESEFKEKLNNNVNLEKITYAKIEKKKSNSIIFRKEQSLKNKSNDKKIKSTILPGII